MKVLVACESSGVVRDAFREIGHDALSCDLLPADNGGPHYQGDVRDLLDEAWDMVLAFPPCTHLAVSGARHFAQKRADGRQQEAIDFFILFTQLACPRVAIENPIGIMSSMYRKPDQIIQPWQFGDDASKKTCLWLKNLPKLNNEDRSKWIHGRIVGEDKRGMTVVRWANQCDSGQNKLAPSADRWKERSKTYTGIAKAMAEQWSSPYI
jgi:hypothetical protein